MQKKTIIYGVLAGASTIFLYALTYSFNKSYFFSAGLHWSTLVFFLIAMWLRIRLLSAEVLSSWRSSIRHPFGVFLIANAIYWIFYYLIFTFEPSMADVHMQHQLETLEQMQSVLGVRTDQDGLQQLVEEIKTGKGSVGIGQIFYSYARGAIGGFLLSFLMVWVARRTII